MQKTIKYTKWKKNTGLKKYRAERITLNNGDEQNPKWREQIPSATANNIQKWNMQKITKTIM